MPKFQIDGTVLAVSVLGAAFGFTLLTGNLGWIASIIGLILAIVLLAFDREGYRSVSESLGYSAAVALCLALASAMLLLKFAHQPIEQLSQEWMPLTWLGLTILISVIDRTRMSGRVQYGAIPPAAPSFSFAPPPVPAPPPPMPVSSPAPVAAAPTVSEPSWSAATPSASQAAAPQPALKATFTRPSFGETVAEPENLAPPPSPDPAPVQPVVPPFIAPAPPPPPAAAPIPSGKETTIYITLVGEGLNVLRAVRAEHLGRDFYKIIENMPEGETWQFGPGQVVRCKKKNLSSGKAMVATEEAPRSR